MKTEAFDHVSVHMTVVEDFILIIGRRDVTRGELEKVNSAMPYTDNVALLRNLSHAWKR